MAKYADGTEGLEPKGPPNRSPDRPPLAPSECCDFGEYTCQVPMPLNGRRQEVDLCIADIVAALNAANIKTVASCCGHGKMNGVISLEDGRKLTINTAPMKGE